MGFETDGMKLETLLIGLLGSVLLGGIWWITQRRVEVAAVEGRAAPPEKKEAKGGTSHED